MNLKKATIEHKIGIRNGVYYARAKIFNFDSQELITTFEKEYPHKNREMVAKISIKEIYKLCQDHKFDYIARLKSTEQRIIDSIAI